MAQAFVRRQTLPLVQIAFDTAVFQRIFFRDNVGEVENQVIVEILVPTAAVRSPTISILFQ